MMAEEKKPGFFARLFHRRRKDLFEYSVASVLAKGIENRLARVSKAERTDSIRLKEALLQGGPGSLAVLFRDRDLPELLLIASDAAISALSSAQERSGDVFEPLRRLSDGLADFLFYNISRDSHGIAFHRYFKRYDSSGIDELLWRASTCACFKVSIAGAGSKEIPLYACIAEDTEAQTEEALVKDDAYQKQVRVLLESGPAAAESTPPLSVRFCSPREFILGGMLLPNRVKCGPHTLDSRYSGLSLLTDKDRYLSAAGVWVLTTCTLGDGKWPVWYFFPSGGPSGDREALKGLVSCMYRDALRALTTVLKVPASSPQIAMDSKPDLSGRTGYAVLKAVIHVGPSRIPCELFIEFTSLSYLMKATLDPVELSSVPHTSASVLPLLFSLSHTLLRGQLAAFMRSFSQSGPAGEVFPFGAFLDLVTDRDRAIVLQNYTLPNIGARGLRRIFGYSEQVALPDGRAAVRTTVPHAFDSEDLLRHLPESARKEWAALHNSPLGSAQEFAALNEETLRGILSAIRRKTLLVSERCLLVLEGMFLPGVRAKAGERLARVTADGVPFRTVRKIPKTRLQQFLGIQPERALCLSLIGAEGELGFLRANMSRKHAAALEEMLTLLRTQYDQGSIEIDEVVRMKEETEKSARTLLEEIAKEAEREGARVRR
jgi:hypothetical protein